jgi:hypothetical protein
MESKMRIFALGLLGALCFVTVLPTAGATPSGPSGALVAPVSKSQPVAHHCGKGQRWIPAGYAKHGKYRAGHCAPA